WALGRNRSHAIVPAQPGNTVQIPASKLEFHLGSRLPIYFRRTNRFRLWSLLLIWHLTVGIWHLFAQPQNPPPGQDPLMSLMMSQPKIDTTSPTRVVAVFDPPIVRPGEQSIFRVTF